MHLPKPTHTLLCLGLLAATAASSFAQYSPAPPRPFPGILNDKLRASDPYMNAWDVGLNLRGRYEQKDDAGFTSAGSNWDFAGNGSGNARDNNNAYFLTRAMPRVGYTDKWFAAFVEGRISSSFDDERGNNPPNPTNAANAATNTTITGAKRMRATTENDTDLNLHQAFVFVGNHKEFPVSLKLGRQELVYGEQRQLGHFRWNNNARTFDAAKVRYQNAWFGVDLWTAALVYNDDRNYNESFYAHDQFNGAYFNFPTLSAKNLVEAFIYQRDVNREIATEDFAGVMAPFRNPAMQELYTVGLRLKSKPGAYGPWDYGVEVMHQFGELSNQTSSGLPLPPTATPATVQTARPRQQDAYAAIGQLGYTWTEKSTQPRLAFIYSYASGDAKNGNASSGTFQNQFATTHLHYGYMDLNSLQNLHDLRLAFTFKPISTVTVALEAHQQFLDKTTDYWYNVAGLARAGGGYAGALNSSSSELGQELDLVVGWYPLIHTHVELGVSHYFAGDYIEENLRRNGTKVVDSSYVYLQVTLNL